MPSVPEYVIEMLHITKEFPGIKANDDITLQLRRGEIHALLGENGAGKSTLMNILGGVLSADSGKIVIDGKSVSFATPVESLDAGIGFIHQELNLINDLTIYENMFITHLPKKGVFLDAKFMQEKTAELFERMNIDLDPCTMVRDLDASYKQIIEIGRALMQNASIIIMDEPTTSLTEPEIKRVFAMMRTLKEQGVGIIFISHKLGEVMEICDRYTVLRDGHMVASGLVSQTDTKQLAAHMVGREVNTDALTREVQSCYICRQLDASMDRYYRTFFALTKEPEFRAKVEKSKGFCLTHFGALLRYAQTHLPNSQRDWFYEEVFPLMENNLIRVKEDLDWLIGKYDYRNASAPWGNSRDALQRTMQKLGGGYVADKPYKDE